MERGKGNRTAEELYSYGLIWGVAEFSEKSRGIKIEFSSYRYPGRSFFIHQNGLDFVEWYTDPFPSLTDMKDVVFIFWMGMGIGSTFPQPTGQFDVYLNDEYLLSFRDGVKENLTWQRGDCSFHYWVKNLQVAPPDIAFHLNEHIQEEAMASHGLGFLKVPKTRVREGRNILKVCSNRKKMIGRPVEPSKRWFRIELPPFRSGSGLDVDKGLKALCGGYEPPEIGEYKVFFGDLHAHSGESKWQACGTGTLDENYEYARDVANLDMFALAEHDWQMPEEGEWELRLEKADEYNEDGCFVTLPCFEWTSQKYGHRNVYYRDSKCAPLFESGPKCTINTIKEGGNPSPTDLWRELRECGAKAITAPHHPNVAIFLLDWTYRDPDFDRLVEVYSNWGNSEYYDAPYSWPPDRQEGLAVQDALAQGHLLGMIASSDSHDGHPGNSLGARRTIGSGLVAVLASELTREAVFDALYERRCYATTGTRILCDFSVNGNVMGSEIKMPEKTLPRTIRAKVEGTANIAYVELVRNNEDILKKEFKGRRAEINFVDRDNIGGACFYYLRVTQQDQEMAWSSPVWVIFEA